MSHPFIERRHRNHAIARVTFDPRTGAYEAMAITPTGEQQHVPDRFTGPDREAQARVAADALAHPMCMGASCPSWQSGSRVRVAAQPATRPPTPPTPPAAPLPGNLMRNARTFIERTHNNDVVARVNWLEKFDSFQATAYHVTPGDLPLTPILTNTDYEARTAADHMAHPHCTGRGCEAWPPAPWATGRRPDPAAVKHNLAGEYSTESRPTRAGSVRTRR